MISASEVQMIESQRRRVRKETYQHILETFDKRIRSAVRLGYPHALVEVPPFVWGYPVYDVYKAADYLKRQLELLGYTVQQEDLVFIVYWKNAPVQEDEPLPADEEDETLPNLVNLRKIATKIIREKDNGEHRRGKKRVSIHAP
jgi:Family of unknown function (DUF5759)